MTTQRHQLGFTFIELILVVALLLVVGLATIPFGYRFFTTNHHSVAVDQVLGKLRKAQAYSMDQRFNTTWGVCWQDDTVLLYAGSCGSPSHSETYQLPDSITLTGLNDVSFSALRGEPSVTPTITISSEIDTIEIVITPAGSMY